MAHTAVYIPPPPTQAELIMLWLRLSSKDAVRVPTVAPVYKSCLL